MTIPGYLFRVNQLVRRLPTISFQPQESAKLQYQRLVVEKQGLGKQIPSTHFLCDSEVNVDKISPQQAIEILIQALSILEFDKTYNPKESDGLVNGAVQLFEKGIKVLGEQSKDLVLAQLTKLKQEDIISGFEDLWTFLTSKHTES